MMNADIVNFLKSTRPFDLLDEEAVEKAAGEVSIEFYPRGLMILRQNGPPGVMLRLIKKGSVKVFVESDEGDEVLIDYRGEGDAFGFVSLLSGDKSRANVVAVEDTVCYLLPKELVMSLLDRQPLLREYFLRSFFVNFIDKTYTGVRNRDLTFGQGERLLFTTPVRELVTKDVVTASWTVSIRQAAEIMSQHKISSLVLVDDEELPVGIVTDRDLREKVVAKDLDVDSPVRGVMTPPLIRVDGGEACFEALIRMIRYNVHHLLVVDGGRLAGVVTNHDFMMLQGTSPLSLVKSIQLQSTPRGLLPMSDRINRITSTLVRNGVKARQVTRLISELSDQLLQKVASIVSGQLGVAPHPFAVVLFGSEGRKEQTFKTSIDCAFVVEHGERTAADPEFTGYFARLADRFREELAVCGLPSFAGETLGGGPVYDSLVGWERRLRSSVIDGDEGAVATAGRFLDLRYVWGQESLCDGLRERIYTTVGEVPGVMERLVLQATTHRAPRGFLRQIVLGFSGDHAALDLKERGMGPIVEGVRVLSLEHGIRVTSTFERIQRLTDDGHRLKSLLEDVSAVLEFLMQIRIEEQVRKREAGTLLDDLVHLNTLTVLERTMLKEAFHVIERFQDALKRQRERSIHL